jgi:hypothetical protein
VRALKHFEEREIAYLLDGMRYALFAASRAFSNIESACRELENYQGQKVSMAATFDILNNCWQVVDQTYRAQQIFAQLSRLGIKDDGTKLFNKCAAKCAKFRSFYHHLKSHISQLQDDSPPIIGSISWKRTDSSTECLTLALNSGASTFSCPGLIFDRQEQHLIDDFVFFACDRSVSLVETARACSFLQISVEKFLESHAAFANGDISTLLVSGEFSAIPPNIKLLS